jgi:hypothetical protein
MLTQRPKFQTHLHTEKVAQPGKLTVPDHLAEIKTRLCFNETADNGSGEYLKHTLVLLI